MSTAFDGDTVKFYINGTNVFSTETTTSLGGNEQGYTGNGSNGESVDLSGEFSFGETNFL